MSTTTLLTPDEHYQAGLQYLKNREIDRAHAEFLTGMIKESNQALTSPTPAEGELRILMLEGLDTCEKHLAIRKKAAAEAKTSGLFGWVGSLKSRLLLAHSHDIADRSITMEEWQFRALETYAAKQYAQALNHLSIVIVLKKLQYFSVESEYPIAYYLLRSHVYFKSGLLSESKQDLERVIIFLESQLKNARKTKIPRDELVAITTTISQIKNGTFEQIFQLLDPVFSEAFLKNLGSDNFDALIQACSHFCISQPYRKEIEEKKAPAKKENAKAEAKIEVKIEPKKETPKAEAKIEAKIEVKIEPKKETPKEDAKIEPKKETPKAEAKKEPKKEEPKKSVAGTTLPVMAALSYATEAEQAISAEPFPELKTPTSKTYFLKKHHRCMIKKNHRHCPAASQNYINYIEKKDPTSIAFSVGGAARDAYLGLEENDDNDIFVIVPNKTSILSRVFPDKAYSIYNFIDYLLLDFIMPTSLLEKKDDEPFNCAAQIVVKDRVAKLKDDALTRDFTINTLYWSNNIMLAPIPEALDDFTNKIIRVVTQKRKAGDFRSNAEISFDNDPIRMLRAFTLLYHLKPLGFRFDEDILPAIKKCAGKLATIPSDKMDLVNKNLKKIMHHAEKNSYLIDIPACIIDHLPSTIDPLLKEKLVLMRTSLPTAAPIAEATPARASFH